MRQLTCPRTRRRVRGQTHAWHDRRMTAIADRWTRIEALFERHGLADQLNPGADPEAVDQLEQDLGVELPAELRESLLRHDGSGDGSWPGGMLLGVDGIRSEATVWRELLAADTFGEDGGEHDADGGGGRTQRGWWREGWVPVHADGGGNGYVVDTEPGVRGRVGQVLFMDHEVGPQPPEHDSLAAWFTDLADQIEAGGLRWTGGSWER